MSNALTDAQILSIWERGIALSANARALLTLEIAEPDVEAGRIAHWPLGRRDGLLLELREATFGPAIRYRARCPFCRSEVEFDVAVESLKQGPASTGAPFSVEIDGVDLILRPPTSEDLAAIEGLEDPIAAADTLFARCVCGAGDEASIASAANESLRARIEAALESADPQADLSFSLSCADCGNAWTAPCDVAQTFWHEIAEAARGVLAQIDALARRYGWTEAQILGLSRIRRDMYLAFTE